jgi:hypothetical protein
MVIGEDITVFLLCNTYSILFDFFTYFKKFYNFISIILFAHEVYISNFPYSVFLHIDTQCDCTEKSVC